MQKTQVTNLPATKSNAASVVYITMHKAASVFVNEILGMVLKPAGMTHVDFAGEAYTQGVKEWEYCVNRSHLFSRPGYYFGAFRGPYIDKFEDLSSNRIVVQIRDPRDCIVSLYYSYKFSHGSPGEGVQKSLFNNAREQTNTMDIDDFALDQAGKYNRRMEMITDLCSTYKNHILLKYEDMVLQFSEWEAELYQYLEIDVSQDIRRKVGALANFDVSEDIMQHKRQVAPGDHLRKLTPATIKTLNDTLSKHLARYGYV